VEYYRYRMRRFMIDVIEKFLLIRLYFQSKYTKYIRSRQLILILIGILHCMKLMKGKCMPYQSKYCLVLDCHPNHTITALYWQSILKTVVVIVIKSNSWWLTQIAPSFAAIHITDIEMWECWLWSLDNIAVSSLHNYVMCTQSKW